MERLHETSNYRRSDDGYTRQQDRLYTEAEKLEQLISETQAQREIHCNNPAQDIVDEDKLKDILDDWKYNYEHWMHPETLNETWHMTRQQWHVFLRRAFRSHLFHITGSYEMTIFFLVAPFNNENLKTFRYFDGNLEKSKDYVRRAAQRQRNTVITTKIIRLGVCIATAWAQSSAQTRSLADYASNAGK